MNDLVAADTARYYAEQNELNITPLAFDPWQDWHVEAVAPYGFAKAIQSLLLRREAGEKDADINALYKACVEKWEDA